MSLGYSLTYSSGYSNNKGDSASNNFPHYVVSDIFSSDNFSQHDGEIQSTLFWTFSYPLLYGVHKETKEVRKRYQISVIMKVFYS